MAQFLLPPQMKNGQCVAIVAPAGKVESGQMDVVVQTLKDWGLTVKFGAHVFGDHYYFSGSDQERLEDIQWALDDPDIDIILSARGGYGVTRILDQINFEKFSINPKWIIGFSDITALHLKTQQMNICSIHGPMGTSFIREGSLESTRALHTLLGGDPPAIEATDQGKMNRSGACEGLLVGGNLALLVDSLGTTTETKTDDKILFIEDVGEPLYKIDRMVIQLQRAGKLDKLAGLVVGDFSEIGEGNTSFGSSLQQIVNRIVQPYSYPIGFNFPIGHEPSNMPVILGANYRLEVSENVSKLSYAY